MYLDFIKKNKVSAIGMYPYTYSFESNKLDNVSMSSPSIYTITIVQHVVCGHSQKPTN